MSLVGHCIISSERERETHTHTTLPTVGASYQTTRDTETLHTNNDTIHINGLNNIIKIFTQIANGHLKINLKKCASTSQHCPYLQKKNNFQ